jgi:hypothetical protein
MDGDFVYWNAIQEIMEELQLEITSVQYRLFFESSKSV